MAVPCWEFRQRDYKLSMLPLTTAGLCKGVNCDDLQGENVVRNVAILTLRDKEESPKLATELKINLVQSFVHQSLNKGIDEPVSKRRRQRPFYDILIFLGALFSNLPLGWSLIEIHLNMGTLTLISWCNYLVISVAYSLNSANICCIELGMLRYVSCTMFTIFFKRSMSPKNKNDRWRFGWHLPVPSPVANLIKQLTLVNYDSRVVV